MAGTENMRVVTRAAEPRAITSRRHSFADGMDVTLALLMQGSGGGGLILRIIKPLELLIKQALQRVIERLVKLRKLYPAINAKMHPFR